MKRALNMDTLAEGQTLAWILWLRPYVFKVTLWCAMCAKCDDKCERLTHYGVPYGSNIKIASRMWF